MHLPSGISSTCAGQAKLLWQAMFVFEGLSMFLTLR